MTWQVDGHWLRQARRVLSPNADERPAGCEPELIVIHAISLPPGHYGDAYIEELFCNRIDPDAHPYFREICQLKVSAHALIKRDGEIVQFVPFNRRAWHAGRSSFFGREACNDFSVGIELEGCDEDIFESVQYEVLTQVIKGLVERYPTLSTTRIAGHDQIAPGRKTDPGPGFDWARLADALNASLPLDMGASAS